MAEVNEKVKITVEAQDKASKELGVIGTKLKDMSSDLKGVKSEMNNTSGSLTKLASGFTLVAAAYKAFDFLKESAAMAVEIDGLTQSYERLTAEMGINAEANLESLRDLSKGTISNKDLILAANRAMTLGVAKNQEEFNSLMQIARLRARDMGLTTTQAFDNIVTGIGRASPMILDNLGILIKQEAAQERYAKSLGKTTEELTANEQKEALKMAVLEEGMAGVKRAGDLSLTYAERMARQTVAVENLKTTIGQALAPTLTQLADILVTNIDLFGQTGNSVNSLEEIAAGKGALINAVFMKTLTILAAIPKAIGGIGVSLMESNIVDSPLVQIINKISGGMLDSVIEKFKSGTKNLGDVFNDIKVDFETIDKISLENLTAQLYGEKGTASSPSDDSVIGGVEATAEAAEKLREAFVSVSKTIVSEVEKQQNKIRDRRQDMEDLNEDYADDAEDIKKRYDKLIKQEEERGAIGFRTRIKEYEQERQDEIEKLQKRYDRQAMELAEKEAESRDYITGIRASVDSPGFLSTASAESLTFLGKIGQAPTQNVINFTFNGDVSDIETLKKQIVDTLNREAQLTGAAGK
jgi:hypothetical protein